MSVQWICVDGNEAAARVVGIRFAHDHGDRVRSLVLVNSVGGSAWTHHGSVLRSMTERPLWDWGSTCPSTCSPSAS